jgi:hypothetical protein
VNPLTLTNLPSIVEVLLALIAKHGHMRRLPGPIVVMVWQRVRSIATQVAALLARMQAGTLRRHPHRRPPSTPTTPRRPATPSPLPQGHAWLIALIQETAVSGSHLQQLLAHPDLPAQLQAAPQLRRALRPLCRMLGVRLPSPPAAPQAGPSAPVPEPPLTPPLAPLPDSAAGRRPPLCPARPRPRRRPRPSRLSPPLPA